MLLIKGIYLQSNVNINPKRHGGGWNPGSFFMLTGSQKMPGTFEKNKEQMNKTKNIVQLSFGNELLI